MCPLNSCRCRCQKCAHLRNLKLADTFPREAASIDLLVGANQYYKLVQGNIRRGRPGTLIATKSRLGWLLSGPVPGSRTDENTTAMMSYSLFGVMLKFCEGRIAMAADVKEIYHMFCQPDCDKPSMKFLWRESAEEEPSVYQFERTVFGEVSAPSRVNYPMR